MQSEADLEQYIKDNTWGHHACCTAAIGGDDDPKAVLDSSFRVRVVQGLRVVDASCSLAFQVLSFKALFIRLVRRRLMPF